jgi:hypothetical protein
MSNLIIQHLARLRQATTNRYSRSDLGRWVKENTYINGRNFSFVDHEFQERIINDQSQEIVIIKSAQLGISEMSMRMALAMIMTMPDGFSVGYIFPTSGFSQQYMRTRLEPIINNSPMLRASSSSEDLDNSSVKTFGPGRQLYAKGAATGNAAISTSLDACFYDEFSFMDQQVAGDYTSRLIHSKHKIKVKLSTPTFPGDAISSAFDSSKRWYNFVKCEHCNETFYPDYYKHVKIPGFSGHLDDITVENLHTFDYQNAQMLCPHCGLAPSLQPEHRLWVCENPDENFNATGYRLSPFDAPNVISLPYLIEASTSYANKAKFRQFNLGLASADNEAGITEEDLNEIGLECAQTPFTTHVMGVDLGMTCHFLVAGVGADMKMGVVHMERVPLARFKERYHNLRAQFRVSVTVSDIQPYTDMVMSLAQEDPNLYGAAYIVKSGLDLFSINSREEDIQKGLGALKQIIVNRNALLDRLLVEIREKRVWLKKMPVEWEVFKRHVQDMKRAAATQRNGEFTSLWQKSSKGNDHYHHALGYCWIASQLRGVASMGVISSGPAIHKFKLHGPALTPQEVRQQRFGIRR